MYLNDERSCPLVILKNAIWRYDWWNCKNVNSRKTAPTQLWISGLYRFKLIVMGINDLNNTNFPRIRPQNKRNHKVDLNLLNHHAGCLNSIFGKFQHFDTSSMIQPIPTFQILIRRITSFRSSKLCTWVRMIQG